MEAIADLISTKVTASVASRQSGRWLTLPEAMEYGRVGKTTIRKWIKEGYIHAHKRTGQWIIDRQSIDDWYTMEG